MLYLFLAVVILIFIGGRTAISYWVDLLWFRSLGYASVFWKSFGLEWGTFAVFAGLTFLILLAAFLVLRHSHAADLPDTHTIFFAGKPIELPLKKFLRAIAIIGSLLVSLATGFAMEAQWQTLALYWYAPRTGNVTDPIFGRPLGFYLFTLPAWEMIAGWLLTLAVIVCVLAVLFLIAAGGGRALGGRFGGAASLPWRGVSIAGGFVLLALAIREYVGRFDLLFQEHTIFDGVTYTDAHVTLIGMLFIAVALALGAVIAIAGGVIRPRARWMLAAVAPAVACYVVASARGMVREHIYREAEPTRQASGLTSPITSR